MIPKIIHQIWLGDQSQRPKHMMQTWIDKNPSWEYRLWTEANVPPLTNQMQFETIQQYCGKADILRYELLLAHGGFYIDADSICLKPLEDWLCDNQAFACYESESIAPRLIANGYLASQANHPLMRLLVERISAIQAINERPAWTMTGPGLLTRVYLDSDYRDLTIYPSHYFIPEHFRGGGRYAGSDHVFAEQYWGSSRKLYGQLA